MSDKNFNTRIQLKNDTETNWDKAVNFIPKKGEAIVYSTDSTHPFSRLKIGDGITSVINLPFLSNGAEVLEYSSLSNFPLTGESGKIYIDTLENSVYRWNGNIYVEIASSITYDVATQSTAGLMSAADKTKLDGFFMESMTMAEYEALSQTEKMDGNMRFITDRGADATGAVVTSIKGDGESYYRTGQVNLTPANIGAYSIAETNSAIAQSRAIRDYSAEVNSAESGAVLEIIFNLDTISGKTPHIMNTMVASTGFIIGNTFIRDNTLHVVVKNIYTETLSTIVLASVLYI